MIYRGRYTAKMPKDYVVFLIGARFNKPWKFWTWLPFMPWMPKMLRWLDENKAAGLLHSHPYFNFREVMIVQYWRTLDDLENFASNVNAPHHPAWKWYNQFTRDDDAIGIWHETYLIHSDCYENVYGNMPRFGLAAAGEHHRISTATEKMRDRIRI